MRLRGTCCTGGLTLQVVIVVVPAVPPELGILALAPGVLQGAVPQRAAVEVGSRQACGDAHFAATAQPRPGRTFWPFSIFITQHSQLLEGPTEAQLLPMGGVGASHSSA